MYHDTIFWTQLNANLVKQIYTNSVTLERCSSNTGNSLTRQSANRSLEPDQTDRRSVSVARWIAVAHPWRCYALLIFVSPNPRNKRAKSGGVHWVELPESMIAFTGRPRSVSGNHLARTCWQREAPSNTQYQTEIPHSHSRILECGMWDVEWNPHSTFHIPKCWNGNWNVDYGMWKSTFQFPFHNFGMWIMELLFWECLTSHHARVHWNVDFGMWNLDLSFWEYRMLKRIGMWIMECGIPHSSSRSIISWCGTWNCIFENVSLLTMLECIGMWIMECGNPYSNSNSHSRISEMCNVECGFPHSTIHIPKFWNGNWNVDFHIP